MGAEDWNWRLPTDLQEVPWDCAATSLAWALRTIGLDWSEAAVVEAMTPEYISPTLGLLDASGAGMVTWLGSIGVPAQNNANATWLDVMAAAGEQPMVIGGRAWCHWVAVRMGSDAAGYPDADMLLLMNPAPGYMTVGQTLEPYQFEELGPFSAVWFPA